MLPFHHENLNLPVHPGDKVWWPNTDTEYNNDVEEMETEGVILLQDKICVLIDNEVLEIGSNVFLSKHEAQAWVDAHRKPSLQDLLNAAGWHENPPPESGKYYVRYPEGDIQKVYYHDGSETGGLAGFYPYRNSFSRIRKPVSCWTYVPDEQD